MGIGCKLAKLPIPFLERCHIKLNPPGSFYNLFSSWIYSRCTKEGEILKFCLRGVNIHKWPRIASNWEMNVGPENFHSLGTCFLLTVLSVLLDWKADSVTLNTWWVLLAGKVCFQEWIQLFRDVPWIWTESCWCRVLSLALDKEWLSCFYPRSYLQTTASLCYRLLKLELCANSFSRSSILFSSDKSGLRSMKSLSRNKLASLWGAIGLFV